MLWSPAAPLAPSAPGLDPGLPLVFPPGWRESVESFTRELGVKGYSTFTIRDYRSDVMRLGAWLGVRPGDLGAEHLKQAERLLSAEGRDEPARRRRRSAYVRFLEFVERERGDTREGRDPKSSLMPTLFAGAASLPANDRLLLGLVYFAGLRLPEIGHLEGRDIRWRQMQIVSRLGYRIVPIHARLMEVLRTAKAEMPFAPFRPLLPGINGYALNARTLHARFQRLAKKAGFPEIRPESLRREASAWLVRNGTPPGLVRAFLGRDRGRPIAPRRGRFVDLCCLGDRLRRLPA